MSSKTKDRYFEVLDLYSKPPSYKFNEEEIELIKQYEPKSNYTIKYCIWKQHRINGKYICFAIELCRQARKSAFEHSVQVICERELTDVEYQEMIENFGTCNRRFLVYNFDNIEKVIAMDKLYNVKTPQQFIDRCQKDLSIPKKSFG